MKTMKVGWVGLALVLGCGDQGEGTGGTDPSAGSGGGVAGTGASAGSGGGVAGTGASAGSGGGVAGTGASAGSGGGVAGAGGVAGNGGVAGAGASGTGGAAGAGGTGGVAGAGGTGGVAGAGDPCEIPGDIRLRCDGDATQFCEDTRLWSTAEACPTSDPRCLSGGCFSECGLPGSTPYCVTNLRDANGNVLTRQVDDDCNGTPDICTTRTYDANGNVLTSYQDGNRTIVHSWDYVYPCNGRPNSHCYTWTYDANGNLLTEDYRKCCTSGCDDGPWRECWVFTYDSSGNKLTAHYSYGYEDPNYCDTIGACWYWTYDANGNMLAEEEDNNCIGSPNRCTSWTYDANGNPLTEQVDGLCDGTWTDCVRFTHDANGNMLTQEGDEDCDGTPDNSCYTWTYDASGNTLTQEGDEDCDGTPDNNCYTWTYDANGNVLTEERQNYCYTWSYDANGNVLTEEIDFNCDGIDYSTCNWYVDYFDRLPIAIIRYNLVQPTSSSDYPYGESTPLEQPADTGTIYLSGADSYDPDNLAIDLFWVVTAPDNTNVALDQAASSVENSFTASQMGTYHVRLEVTELGPGGRVVNTYLNVPVEEQGPFVYGIPGQSCTGMIGNECQGIDCCQHIVVPAGTFPMGRSTSGSDAYSGGDFNEVPEHDATVARFGLDTFEVTVGRFRRFVEVYNGTPPDGSAAHPWIPGSGWQSAWNVNLPPGRATLIRKLNDSRTWTDTVGANEVFPISVDWYEAFAFCAWDGGRLPTEAEWEVAAAGGTQNRLYPWGQETPSAKRANYGNNSPFVPVGSYPAGAARWGHHDLAGSVWEWVLDAGGGDWISWGDWYSGAGNPCDNCANLSNPARRVHRGGGWKSPQPYLRAAKRYGAPPFQWFSDTVGFRCARNVK